MTTLTLGYSPCPNDTFIFYALMHNKVRVPGVEFREQLEDVETLNRLALAGTLDLTKISYHAFGHLRDQYALLRSGSALGRGCGPLIVARPGARIEDLGSGAIAIPGELTTAALLLRLFDPRLANFSVMPFDCIMDAVVSGKAAAGLIIHESRFTYQRYGLEQLLDLGAWWERTENAPIPLGGILARRSLGAELSRTVETGIRQSVEYAWKHADETLAYCRCHSQEMDEEVMRKHIELYVNDFTLDLGSEGIAAVRRLMAVGEEKGIFPASKLPLLATE
jgi:1,4-dihydroxy-6-naphthoate synthase